MKGTNAFALAALAIASGCVTGAHDEAGPQVRVTPDDPAAPREVRFDVPTVMLLGHPGDDRIPATLKARMATRALAARELAARGYCPDGFAGPAGIRFAEGDRRLSRFVVRCRG
jgi:hypothetical protein